MPKTVLAVDDSPTMLEWYQLVFGIHGKNYKLLLEGNPQAALKRFEIGESIDLLVTDLRMPAINGFELIKRVHQIAPTTKYILNTGADESRVRNDLERLKSEGIDVAYFNKLPDEHSLINLVKSLIGE